MLQTMVIVHLLRAKCLLCSGADISLRSNKRGRSPLFVASMSGHCDLVKCLLSSGADINLRDEGGQSPGDRPPSSRKLISAPELSKHLTTFHSSFNDAIDKGDCPFPSHKLIYFVMLLNVYLVLVQISIGLTERYNHHCF
jgi:ankyrin repeat protein